ncbi:MAG: right-handed parallel beta-helix repeat-containing protein [Planctomycetota bacterium]|nr:right-handed parallel beta-helix repeat-containing protein [Planctomycetota bacterium]
MAARTTLSTGHLIARLGGSCAALAATLALAGVARGAEYLVEPGQSIQAVIDDPATMDGDVVIVLPGVYQELIDFRGKAITLQSVAPQDWSTVAETVLDGAAAGCVVSFVSGEGPDTVLEGFTVTGGYDASGGGMRMFGASPTVRYCLFKGNDAMYEGGAMLADFQSGPEVLNCRFLDNTASYGGAVSNITSVPLIVNCDFAGNTALYGGTGGAIDNLAQSDAFIVNCTFFANHAGAGGAVANSSSAPTLSNCVLWGNSSDYGDDEIVNYGELATVRYCDVAGSGGSQAWDSNLGYDGGGNLDADPLFVDAYGADGLAGTADDDRALQAASPCIDAARNDDVPADAGDMDADGDVMEPLPFDLAGAGRFMDDPLTEDTGAGAPPLVDMGAFEYQPEGGLEIELPMDIRPRRCPNWLHRRSYWFLPVAVLGTEACDVREVDLSTLEMGRADGVGGWVAPQTGRPMPWPRHRDVTAPAEPCDCQVLPRDGRTDLLLRFRIRDLVSELELGDLPRNEVVELVLLGELNDGTPFIASDCVMVKGRPKPARCLWRRWHRR